MARPLTVEDLINEIFGLTQPTIPEDLNFDHLLDAQGEIDESKVNVACAPSDPINRDEEHMHQCDSCGKTWKHTNFLNALGASTEVYHSTHTCECGAKQFNKYFHNGY